MATENILMYCTKRGGDRQKLHEAIREHSVACAKQIKLNGAENDLLERILNDERFGLTVEEMNELTDPKTFTGCAEKQTVEYLEYEIKPLLEKYRDMDDANVSINV